MSARDLPQAQREVLPAAFTLHAADGFPLAAHHWNPVAASPRAVVVVNPATAVKASYYHRYAKFLAAHGMAVLTYDYRGIGGSHPGSLRRIRRASKLDWGHLDCDAALRWARETYPGLPIHVVGHSIGGMLIGLAKHNVHLDRCLTVGAQYGYWRDYEKGERLAMWLRWHVLMPTLTALWGYFPAKRLGWHEDLPAAAAYEWAFRPATLEAAYRRGGQSGALAHFAGMRGDILALSLTDDAFGTRPAIERLLGYFADCRRVHARIEPGFAGETKIGHFAFFHDRFKDTLWLTSLEWLATGRLPEGEGVDVTDTPAS